MPPSGVGGQPQEGVTWGLALGLWVEVTVDDFGSAQNTFEHLGLPNRGVCTSLWLTVSVQSLGARRCCCRRRQAARPLAPCRPEASSALGVSSSSFALPVTESDVPSLNPPDPPISVPSLASPSLCLRELLNLELLNLPVVR